MNEPVNDSKVVECILGLKKLKSRKSCLMLALQSARFHFGRDKNTGKGNISDFYYRQNRMTEIKENVQFNKNEDEVDLFSGLILYLIVLEQLGTIFINENKNSIKGILKLYANDLLNEERNAIKNLRNSLAHNHGLVACCSNGNPICKFVLSFKDKDKPVELPKYKWNHKYEDKSEGNSIKINVLALINLIEEIIAKVIKEYTNGKLVSKLSKDELESRFTILCD